MWRTLDTGRAGAVGVGVTIDPQGSINRHARARHVPATESGLCGGQLVRLARRQPPRRHGQPRRRAQRNDDQSDILPNLRSVPFERAAHGPMTQRHARDTERAARNEAAGRAAMATGASGRSVRLAAADRAAHRRQLPEWRSLPRLQTRTPRGTTPFSSYWTLWVQAASAEAKLSLSSRGLHLRQTMWIASGRLPMPMAMGCCHSSSFAWRCSSPRELRHHASDRPCALATAPSSFFFPRRAKPHASRINS